MVLRFPVILIAEAEESDYSARVGPSVAAGAQPELLHVSGRMRQDEVGQPLLAAIVVPRWPW